MGNTQKSVLQSMSPQERSLRSRERISAREKRLPESLRSFYEGIPLKHKGLISSTLLERGAASSHIKAKCLDCSSFQIEEITNCTVKSCGLWHIRPYREK